MKFGDDKLRPTSVHVLWRRRKTRKRRRRWRRANRHTNLSSRKKHGGVAEGIGLVKAKRYRRGERGEGGGPWGEKAKKRGNKGR